MKQPSSFRRRYGPTALIAGASEGIGAAFAKRLATQGFNLVLAARRELLLDKIRSEICAQSDVLVETCVCDLSRERDIRELTKRSLQLDVGLLVCNAALSPIGYFVDRPESEHMQLIDLNCRAATMLTHTFGNEWIRRKRTGGMIIMSSIAGLQGTAMTAHYAASKAYLRVLAEGLWNELAPHGIDVLASAAGPTETPAYTASQPRESRLGTFRYPPVQSADAVVADALDSLGQRPVTFPGLMNGSIGFLLRRLLPAQWGIRMVSNATRKMYPR